MYRKRKPLLSIVALFVLAAAALPAQGATPKTKRVSIRSDEGQAEGGDSRDSDVSATGRFVTFQSSATNLVPNDDNGALDIFVRDRREGTTRLVSMKSNGDHAEGGESYTPSISADGRYITFTSEAVNLAPGDDGDRDVFVHNRVTGRTKIVSVHSNGDHGDDDSDNAEISGNGRYVAFESDATNLSAADSDPYTDVFVHDRETGRTRLAGRTASGDAPEGGDSYEAALSHSGRFVAFVSGAGNLVPGDGTVEHVMVFDRKTEKTRTASKRTNGTPADGSSYEPTLSADGSFVAFHSYSSNLVGNDTNGVGDIFVHNRVTKRTERVSLKTNGDQAVDGDSTSPSISGSGRYVAFESDASNLGPGDVGEDHIFLYDRRSDRLRHMSRGTDGTVADDRSVHPQVSADARFVIFRSAAENLVPGDDNGFDDIFIRGPLR